MSFVFGALCLAASMFAILAEVLSPIFLVGWMLWGVAHTFSAGVDAAYLYDALKARGRALADSIGMPLTIGAAGIVLAVVAALLIGLWRRAVSRRAVASESR